MSRLDAATAARFARVAAANVVRPYPHKLDHLLTAPPSAPNGELDHRRLHPAFYGSYDWHSAVHMHWTLARIHRLFPSGEIAACLNHQLNEDAMAAELAYFRAPAGRMFERPYGWAWLLKLHAELAGTPWEAAVAPLAGEIAARFGRFLDAPYPIRAGSHGNTAFACLLALAHEGLRSSIGSAARRWYLGDRDAPIPYEPSLDDFLSPTLVEAALMKEVLSPEEFAAWLPGFMRSPGKLEEPPSGFDRADAKQVHLDGLSLSRAWCLRRLGFSEAAEKHLSAALPHIEDDYVGTHWLASFALLALTEG